MNIEPKDFLSDEQKKDIGEALTKKLLEGIAGLQFAKGRKLDLTANVTGMINDAFENSDIYEHMNLKKIADKIVLKVVEGI